MLAGGRATRFGGDKGAALFCGRALIDHAADALREQVDGVIVVGRDWPGLASVADWPAPHLGPLGGIAGALRHGAEKGYAVVLTVGADMPSVPGELLAALLRRAPSYCRDAPILGHWPVAVLPSLERLLADMSSDAGKQPSLSIRRWAESIGALPIAAPGPLANVNTPADLALL